VYCFLKLVTILDLLVNFTNKSKHVSFYFSLSVLHNFEFFCRISKCFAEFRNFLQNFEIIEKMRGTSENAEKICWEAADILHDAYLSF